MNKILWAPIYYIIMAAFLAVFLMFLFPVFIAMGLMRLWQLAELHFVFNGDEKKMKKAEWNTRL